MMCQVAGALRLLEGAAKGEEFRRGTVALVRSSKKAVTAVARGAWA